MTNDPREDGYVECNNCGHLIEQHDTNGCQAVDGCPCLARWTRREISDVRARYGLPRRYAA